jgi:hypothetical protein
MTSILVENLTAGMILVNIGTVSSVEREETAKLIRVVVIDGIVLSAAFYWYRFGTFVFIR